jgi:hypothetical protein
MTRFLYGGGGDGDIIQMSGAPYANTVASVYDARTGGTRITDLQNISGSAVTSVTTDVYGQAVFYGPDNYIGVLWLDFGVGSVRWALSPKAVDLAAARVITTQRAADAAGASTTAKAALPYNAADPLEQALAAKLDPLVLPRFSSQAARDAAFPSPQEGDRCYRLDLRAEQVYNVPLAGWFNASYATNRGTSGPAFSSSWTLSEVEIIGVPIPANMPAGTTFRLTAYGVTSVALNTTPDLALRFRLGGLTGTIIGSNWYTAASNPATATRPWQLTACVTITSTGTSGTWFGNLTSHSLLTSTTALTTTGASVRCDGSAEITRDTTTATAVSLTSQWSASSPLTSTAVYGWFWERVN